jgi:hypothetical protein
MGNMWPLTILLLLLLLHPFTILPQRRAKNSRGNSLFRLGYLGQFALSLRIREFLLPLPPLLPLPSIHLAVLSSVQTDSHYGSGMNWVIWMRGRLTVMKSLKRLWLTQRTLLPKFREWIAV